MDEARAVSDHVLELETSQKIKTYLMEQSRRLYPDFFPVDVG